MVPNIIVLLSGIKYYCTNAHSIILSDSGNKMPVQVELSKTTYQQSLKWWVVLYTQSYVAMNKQMEEL